VDGRSCPHVKDPRAKEDSRFCHCPQLKEN
jgi:hypothetical protein